MEIFASARIQKVVLHDLRTPLNIIKLVLQMLDASPIARDPEVADDLATIRSGEVELERMLILLADVARLPRDRAELAPGRFNPRRLFDDAIAGRGAMVGSAGVEFVDDGSVDVVDLDHGLAKMAVEKVLGNVAAATRGAAVRVRLSGGPKRCVVAFESDVPPRSSVSSHALVSDDFERLLGNEGDRRGLDLSIAATISTLFGGTARLVATPGQGTIVILDWPSTIGAADSAP